MTGRPPLRTAGTLFLFGLLFALLALSSVGASVIPTSSTGSASITPTLTAQASSYLITATQPVMITAYLTPQIPNLRTVYLQSSRNGVNFAKVGAMRFSSGMNRYYMTVKPASNTYYRVVWVRPGTTSRVSARLRVLVRPRLRLYASSYAFPWGRRTTIFGNVWPNHAGSYVQIQILSGSTWRILFKPKLNKYSKYSVVFKPRLKGTYRIRAYFGPSWDHPANSTSTRNLHVVQGAVNREGRGLWVTRWSFRPTKAEGTADIARIMRNASEANLNIVYFQVRGQGDAYYRSHYEPWAKRLTGTLGKDPGWDPLQTAIDYAHRNGMKLHAWVNVFTMWQGTTRPTSSTPQHIYFNPGWKVATRYWSGGTWHYRDQSLSNDYLWATPGNRAVRDHVTNVVADIVSNYAVDGVHLDRIRYPGPQYSYDKVSNDTYSNAYAAYGAAHNGARLSRSTWQRWQVTAAVSSIYHAVKTINPKVQVSAAAWGIYTNRWKWPGVSDGLKNYYQDSQSWPAAGVVDFLAPMTFWDLDHIPRWATLVSDFVSHSAGRGVYAGIAAYQYRSNFREIQREIAAGRSLRANGFSFFDYSALGGRWVSLSSSFPLMVDPPSRGTPTDVSLEATTTTPANGENLVLQGTLLPSEGHAGKTIKVMMYEDTRWTEVAEGDLDAWSHYQAPFTVPRSGTIRLRAVFAGDSDHAGTISRELVLTVP